MAVQQERLAFAEPIQHPPRPGFFTVAGLRWFAGDARGLFVIGLIVGIVGVAILSTAYEHPADEVITVMSVLVVVGYLVSRVLKLTFTQPVTHAGPTPRGFWPFFLCVAFSVLCILCAVVVAASAGIYFALDLPWAVSLAGSGMLRLATGAGGGLLLAALFLLIQIGIRHKDRLLAEIYDAFSIVGENLRIPHGTLRQRFF